MKFDEYINKLLLEINRDAVNPNILHDWYGNLIGRIENIHQQSKSACLPKQLGELLEKEFKNLLSEILPSTCSIINGHAINITTAKSREQDLLLYDNTLGQPFITTQTFAYVPIEYVIGSIEVKSNLTLQELRKAVMNCVSLKKLNYPHGDKKHHFEQEIYYSIFAFSSSITSSKIFEELDKILFHVPEHLRPNFIYVHNCAIFYPASTPNEVPRYESIIDKNSEYTYINLSSENKFSRLLTYLYFQLLVEHINTPRTKKTLNYFNYYYRGEQIKQSIENTESPFKQKYYYHSASTYSNNQLMSLFYEEICTHCQTTNRFLPKDNLLSKAKLQVVSKALENAQVIQPTNKCYNCFEIIKVDINK